MSDDLEASEELLVDEHFRQAFAPYIAAVGSVIDASNKLQQGISFLFLAVTGMSQQIGLAMWYSIQNDRTQRSMLSAAIDAIPDEEWEKRSPSATADLKWFLDTANDLAECRNSAAHMPVSLAVADNKLVAIPVYFFGNPRAVKLKDADIVAEFIWCRDCAKELLEFCGKLETAISHPPYPWPERPALPVPLQRSSPRGQSRRRHTKPRVRQRRASPV
jgi:hypothetical protein